MAADVGAPAPRSMAALAIVSVVLALVPRLALAKKVEGHLALAPRQSVVVAKFCFDSSAACQKAGCAGGEPGMIVAEAFGGRRTGAAPAAVAAAATTTTAPAKAKGGGDVVKAAAAAIAAAKAAQGAALGGGSGASQSEELTLALFDDQYSSFPEVAPVWSEATCSDLLKAARRTESMPWKSVASPLGTGNSSSSWRYTKHLVESVRPRWWYIAFVSCSNATLEFSYRLQMSNPLQGLQSELSTDALGVAWWALALSGAFAMVAWQQLQSARQWLQVGAPGVGPLRSVLRLHPAVALLTAATLLAAVGEVAWLLFYWGMEASGDVNERLATGARASLLAAKFALSLLLLLMAHGWCTCVSEVIWAEHRELAFGLALFSAMSFFLESWSESEFRTTTTEYVYDTRAGTLLVAADLLWLWLYVSRSWRTYQNETRPKSKLFYGRYGVPLTLWFASLPLVAALARALDPWVRFRITFAVNGSIHVAALALLVHTFRPSIAPKLYELGCNEYQPVSAEELDKFLQEDDDDI